MSHAKFVCLLHEQRAKAQGGASATGGGSGRTATNNAVQADGVVKIMKGLKGDLETAMQRAMEKVEAECGAFGEWGDVT